MCLAGGKHTRLMGIIRLWSLCLLWLLWGAMGAVYPAQGADNAQNVLQTVCTRALFPPQNAQAVAEFSTRPDRNSPEIIRQFLASFDPWATWSDAKERAQTRQLRAALGSGVGLDIVRNRAGELVCLPYPNSPAQQAGLEDGDILTAVDGYSVVGAELNDVAVLVLGKAGTTVQLSAVRQPQGASLSGAEAQTFSIRRGKTTPPRVQMFRHEGMPALTRIKVYRFDEKTAAEFAVAVKKAGSGPLVLDLRGNSGGQMLAALSCAAMLLPEGSWLYTTAGPGKSVRKFTEKTGAFVSIHPVAIWQDSLTASAAEIFVAALVDTRRAVAFGEPTYGKARVQDVFSFDSSVLELTTQALLRADNSSWHETGLLPQISVHPQNMAALLQKTQEYFGRNSQ